MSLRKLLKKVQDRCNECRLRYTPTGKKQQLQLAPFSAVALDTMGPIRVTSTKDNNLEKNQLLIITCMTSWVVQKEIRVRSFNSFMFHIFTTSLAEQIHFYKKTSTFNVARGVKVLLSKVDPLMDLPFSVAQWLQKKGNVFLFISTPVAKKGLSCSQKKPCGFLRFQLSSHQKAPAHANFGM